MLSEPPGRVALISMHVDILPAQQFEATTELADAMSPTRPTANIEYPLGDDACLIGRDLACQVRIAEHRIDISRKHGTIKPEHGEYVLYDHSLHGTFVNGRQINGPCRLNNGDIIGLANTREMLRFVDTNHPQRANIVLTEREHEILRLLATGRRIKEIAEQLVISQNTVNSHLKNLYGKLGVSSRGEAISQATRLHLI
jgi:DNA-binding CsgD family transcriptional regulator